MNLVLIFQFKYIFFLLLYRIAVDTNIWTPEPNPVLTSLDLGKYMVNLLIDVLEDMDIGRESGLRGFLEVESSIC